MESRVRQSEPDASVDAAAAAVDAAVGAVDAALDALAAALVPEHGCEAIRCVKTVERLRRRFDAVAVGLLGHIDTELLFIRDGHSSAKAMVRHHGELSGAEAAGRAKTANVCADLPDVADAYRAGSIGTDQMRLLGRVHANVRVRSDMVEHQDWFLNLAATQDYKTFEKHVRRWETLTDEDGAEPVGETSHENRNAQLIQQFDNTWDLKGRYSPLQGASMREIFDFYVQAEFETDWEKARAEHSDTACADNLPRTQSQRRADALWQIFQDAAAAPHGSVPPAFVHNIIWDHTSFEEMIRRLDGQQPQTLNVDTTRCETLDGHHLDLTETITNAVISKIRRVIVDASSTVIDLGTARFFTGNARHAIKLTNTTCIWPGCLIPTTRCEADHTRDHSTGGRTEPGNGAPMCRKHNRHKHNQKFTVWRDPTGHFHILRPDGTPLE